MHMFALLVAHGGLRAHQEPGLEVRAVLIGQHVVVEYTEPFLGSARRVLEGLHACMHACMHGGDGGGGKVMVVVARWWQGDGG